MVTPPLADRQIGILACVINDRAENSGRPPAIREIALKTGVSIGEVDRHIRELERRGYVRRLPGARGVVPLRHPDGRLIEAFGDAMRVASLRPAPPPDARYRTIEAAASNYVDLYAGRFPDELTIPVPVERIAEHFFGLRVYSVPLPDGISGQLTLRTGVINVHIGDKPARQRFTIGHELGHCFLHAKAIRNGLFSCGRPATAAERDAECFAGCLLMPTAAVRGALKEYRSLNPSLTTEQFIAGRFAVSPSAARVRLKAIERPLKVLG